MAANDRRSMTVETSAATDHRLPTTNHGQFAIVEPDPAEWDAFTAGHPGGHLLQSSGWGALKQQGGWQARRGVGVGAAGAQGGGPVLLRRGGGLWGGDFSR